MKKFFALVLSLILILSLTACGGSDSSTDSAPDSGASSADPAAKTEIVYGKSQGPYTELFEAAIVPILEEQGYTLKGVDFSDLLTADIAGLLGVEPAGIIYTSGASESNNLAIKGIAQASRNTGRHMISTVLEHASVGGTLTALQQQGWEVDLLDIQRDGTIDLEQLGDLLRKDTILVSVCAVDSELGTVQPIRQITEILKDFPNCRLHVDATQAIGKTELVMDGVDTMSIAPHKFYGLNGSGLLLKKSSVIIEPQIHGGSSTTLYRSGTPALALAVSIEKALQLTLTQQEERIRYVRQLNEYLKTALLHYPSVRINSPEGAVPHILNLSVQGLKGTVFQRVLSERGVCVSVKSACSAEGTPSKAVFAVSGDRKNALSSWRVSLSHLTTREELDEFLQVFDQCYKELGP